jgi:hypothetical protein
VAGVQGDISLKTFKVTGAKSGKLPSRFKLLNWGENDTVNGRIVVDDQTARVFAGNQRKIGRETVVLDYEHNTVPGTAEYERTREPRETAATLTLTVVPGEGLFGENVTYTMSGIANADNFPDLSLAPYCDRSGRVVGAHSVALTRAGAAHGIEFTQAAALSAGEIATHLQILSANQNTPQNIMPAKTIEELSAEISGLIKPLSDRIAALEARPAVDIAPLSASITALEKKLTDGEAAQLGSQRAELVTLFARDGKAPKKADGTAYSADELKALDLPTLQLLHANTPVTVPLSARNAAQVGESAKSKHRDEKGNVNLASIFDEENAATAGN